MKLSKNFESKQYEELIYALWEKSEVFRADPHSKKTHFSIAMPPPNETGTLGVHHALFLTLQDIIVRHARMKNLDVLWLPGTDHAALPVNSIIEKQLAAEGLTKHQIGREEFLSRTRKFVSGSRETMLTQMRAVGISADWSRLRYTLDDTLVRVVNETFIAMYKQGVIYRGERIVNWDSVLETTVSDDEVDYKTEITKLYTLKFGPFEITTARPETKLGDKYVVMHPEDKRYVKYKDGDTFKTEWINGEITATIIKDDVVDMSFGTGVMTITPWHSQVDFEIAQRHNLPAEQIIDFHGRLLPICEEFKGMTINEARPKIIDKLATKGLVVKIDDNYQHNVAINSRGGAIIEPQIRLQWFVDVNKKAVSWKNKIVSFKEVLTDVVVNGDITIIPKRFEKVYFNWINNLKDWCISRQIWWGHRIPVWYRTDTDGKEEVYVGLKPPIDDREGFNDWRQDPDTLDTWFSSALWTFSTLIDPALTENMELSFKDLLAGSMDFKVYHPTTVLETGWDIIFFWVARMILATTFMTGQVPFKQVYLHGLVRTKDGKKMSKSRPESIINPIDVINQYGADALRLSLIMGVSPGNDQVFSYDKVQSSRNFCNKLWNIARFVEGMNEGKEISPDLKLLTDADYWIIKKISDAQTLMIKQLDKYQFSEAYDVLYRLVWNDYADWYVEFSKNNTNLSVLILTLQAILALAHPFAPFVTETIWQTLSLKDNSILSSENYFKMPKSNLSRYNNFEEIKNIIIEARDIIHKTGSNETILYYNNSPIIVNYRQAIKRLTGVSDVIEVQDGRGLYLTSTSYHCWLDIDQASARAYISKLDEKIKHQQYILTILNARLNNKEYLRKAPKQLVQDSRLLLQKTQQLLNSLIEEADKFRVK